MGYSKDTIPSQSNGFETSLAFFPSIVRPMALAALQHSKVRYPETFDVTPSRGFLPVIDPLERLPAAFTPWEKCAQELPGLLATGQVRSALRKLPLLTTAELDGQRQYERAMLLLSYFGNAYVWGEKEGLDRLPACMAVPWHEVSLRLGRPPVLSYASYALHNWKRLDPSRPIELGNLLLLQHFLGGLDEAWFILVHVAIEARAGRALAAIWDAQRAAADQKPQSVVQRLNTIEQALQDMHGILLRMPEGCDPYVYYHRVRPYIHGWKNNPALPEGLVYEGVEAYGGLPRQFRGETGAQSAIVPSLDAALGIEHQPGPLHDYLLEMRDYMPPRHRAFIEAIEQGPAIRAFVLENSWNCPGLATVYNTCVRRLERFRSTHLEYAKSYIQQQSQRSLGNPTDVGTGGTPFIPYLQKHRDETADHLVPEGGGN